MTRWRRFRRSALLLPLALLLLASACRREPTRDEVESFAAANAALAQATTPAECRAIAARYEELLVRAGANGAVLHGLGNAWFRAGDAGRAIAAWRRAERLRPRDPWLAANLAQARQGLPTGTASLVELLLPWRDELSIGEQAWTFTLTSALACLALLGQRGLPRARATLRAVAWLTAVLAILALLTFARTILATSFTRHAVISGTTEEGDVVVRKGDGESFAPALTEAVRPGTECIVRDTRGGYVQVELPGGHVGWVPESRVVAY